MKPRTPSASCLATPMRWLANWKPASDADPALCEAGSTTRSKRLPHRRGSLLQPAAWAVEAKAHTASAARQRARAKRVTGRASVPAPLRKYGGKLSLVLTGHHMNRAFTSLLALLAALA